MNIRRPILLRATLLALFMLATGYAPSAHAQNYADIRLVTVNRDFKEVAQDVADAIVNNGLVIDYRGYIGKMLKRTRGAAGSTKTLYRDAQYFQFCSALYSRRMIEADLRNIAYCPFVIVVYELAAPPGKVYVGYRRPPKTGSEASRKALSAVDKLLAKIVKEATE